MNICEEAYEKGPIESKYCLEKKCFQIFKRRGKKGLMHCFDQTVANIHTLYYKYKKQLKNCKTK